MISGLRSWDVDATGCDLNAELQNVATAAPTGEEDASGKIYLTLCHLITP